MKKAILLIAAMLLFSLAVLVPGISASAETDEFTADWGVKNTQTGQDGNTYTYWEDDDGTFSTVIGADGVTWLYLEYIDHRDILGTPVYGSGWIGLQNIRKPDGTMLFRTNSRFYVRIVPPDTREWYVLRDQMDLDANMRIDTDSMAFFVIGVTDVNGEEYRDLGDLTMLFIQLSPLFEHVRDMTGENVGHVEKILPMNGIPTPEAGRYTVLLLNHFGENFVLASYDNVGGSVLSGGSLTVIVGVAAAVVFGLGGFFLGRKKKTLADGAAKANEDTEN